MWEMQRRTFLLRAAALAAAGLPLNLLEACAPTSSPANATAAPAATAQSSGQAAPGAGGSLKSFKYGDLKSLGDVGIYVAAEEGYFAEQGLQVEITSFDSAANMVAPLGGGQLDAAGGAISAGLFNAFARNIPMKIVADKGHSEPTPPGFPVSIYLARKALVDSAQVKSAADLKGRKFGWVARGISTELDLAAFLKSGGLAVGDVDLTQMGFPDMVSALANGAIDACAPPEPFATNMVGQGTAAILGYDYQVNPRNQVAVILYGADFAKSDLAPRFMVAYIRAVRLYNDAFLKKDPTARQKVIAAATRYSTVKDPALYDKMQLQGLDPNGALNVDSIREQQDYFLSTSTQQERVNLDNYVDVHFAQDAVRQLGPYA
jgi:NitT/TauT family transport system substrate-binding protein